MTIPQLPLYVAPYKPLNNITPFTYRDGLTYLEVLEELREHLNESNEFVNENFDALGDSFEAEVNRLIAAVNEAIEELITEEATLQDATVAALISDTESVTRQLLDGLYAGQETSDEDVAAYVNDSDGHTRTALDNLYAGQETTDADIAAYVADEESATNAAILNLIPEAGPDLGTDSDVAGYISDEESLSHAAVIALIPDGPVASGGGYPISQFLELSSSNLFTLIDDVSVMYGDGNGFFATGYDGTDLTYLTSSDGVIWSKNLIDSVASASPWGYVARSETLIVVFYDGTVYTSADNGTTWNDDAVAPYFAQLFWSETLNVFIGYEGSGNVYTSNDGITWTSRSTMGASYPVAATMGPMTEVADRVVIPALGWASYPPAGNPSSGVVSSDDGLEWVFTLLPTAVENTPYVPILNVDGDAYALFSSGPGIAKTEDGVTWVDLPDAPTSFNGVAASTGSHMVCEVNDAVKYVYVSADGETWYRDLVEDSTTPNTLVAANGVVVAFNDGTSSVSVAIEH